MSFLRGLGAAYLGLLKRVGSVVLVIVLSAALSFVVVYPLWLFATTARRAYTITVLSVAAAGLVTVLAIRLIRRIRGDSTYIGGTFLPALRRAAVVVSVLVGIYLTLWLYSMRSFWAALPLTAVLAAAVGFGARRR